jgi:hypothetical protein
MMPQPQKPRATAKNFPDVSLVQARKLAKTANQIVDVLWPLSPRTRKEVLSKAVADLGSKDA